MVLQQHWIFISRAVDGSEAVSQYYIRIVTPTITELTSQLEHSRSSLAGVPNDYKVVQ